MSTASQTSSQIGPFRLNRVVEGDCAEHIPRLPDESIDIVVTSPPYWGQRTSAGVGVEPDPRVYVDRLSTIFIQTLPKLKDSGIMWINIGDAYNTPVNWRASDYNFSTLGASKSGLDKNNSAYVKPRFNRRAYTDEDIAWLQYGNLLALPYRLVLSLCDAGYLFRGEVIWRKANPMPEGRPVG